MKLDITQFFFLYSPFFFKKKKINLLINNQLIIREDIDEKYDGKLQIEYQDKQLFEVVSSIFKALTKKKLTVPGTFQK